MLILIVVLILIAYIANKFLNSICRAIGMGITLVVLLGTGLFWTGVGIVRLVRWIRR